MAFQCVSVVNSETIQNGSVRFPNRFESPRPAFFGHGSLCSQTGFFKLAIDGSTSNYKIAHESLEKAIYLVAKAAMGAVMMKRGLKSTFYRVLSLLPTIWLLIFEWNGMFCVDLFLPLGLRTASCIFNIFSEG